MAKSNLRLVPPATGNRTVAGTLPPLSNFFNRPARRRGFFGGGQKQQMLDRLRSCAYGNSRFRASRKRFPKARC